jgi:aminoglycoside phosphotransferase (APT) family kinase protein
MTKRITSPVPFRPSLTARYQALHTALEHLQAADFALNVEGWYDELGAQVARLASHVRRAKQNVERRLPLWTPLLSEDPFPLPGERFRLAEGPRPRPDAEAR